MATIVLICAPKGGVGKTTLATNVAVAAAVTGLRVAGLDFDSQKAFALWGQDRDQLTGKLVPAAQVEVVAGHLQDWREHIRLLRHHDVLVIDTPPRVDDPEVSLALQQIGDEAGIILMPVEVYRPSIKFVAEFMSLWWPNRAERPIFVLNKTIAGRLLLREAQTELASVGRLWRETIPLRDDLSRLLDLGLGAKDSPSYPCGELFAQLWTECAATVRLPVPAGAYLEVAEAAL